MTQIRNKSILIKNGATERTRKARALTIRSLECALNAADPKKLLLKKLTLKGSCLLADGISYDLVTYQNIYVVGGGKASGAMAEALEEVLGKRITAGAVNVPYGTKQKTSIIKLHEANHPVPDQAGVEGTMRMVGIAEIAEKDDFVICLISGGGSSLMPLPREGVSLGDKRTLTDALLKCGAAITEVNTVRKHLSAFKGGWLAKKAYPATVLNLVLSDVMGDPLNSIASGPTVPDPSTFADAQKILEKYGLWSTASSAVRKTLSDGIKGLAEETPKPGEPEFEKVHNVVVGNNRIACQAAAEHLKSKGLNTLICADALEGEARDAGKALVTFASKLAASGKLPPKPAGIIAGGETTVTVTGKGLGGRNQELALSAMLQLEGVEGFVMACLSTDGVDGPTDAAGAIVDSHTLARAIQLGLKPEEFLAENDSYRFFSKLGELICTGQTGTNVNDISVIVVL
jgi:glycerate-2-kinase